MDQMWIMSMSLEKERERGREVPVGRIPIPRHARLDR